MTGDCGDFRISIAERWIEIKGVERNTGWVASSMVMISALSFMRGMMVSSLYIKSPSNRRIEQEF